MFTRIKAAFNSVSVNIAAFFGSIAVAVIPRMAGAQAMGFMEGLKILEKCDARPPGHECAWPELLILFNEVISFGIFLATMVAIVVIIWTGFKIMTSGSPDEIKNAKASLWKVMMGYFFMLCAWLIVKELLKFFGVDESYQLLAQ